MQPNESTLQYHDVLNPALFQNNHLIPSVRQHLLDIANAFIQFANVPNEVVKEIVGTGGNFNYNYTNISDIDVHIIIDQDKIPVDPIWLNDYFFTKKSYWTARHKITVKGYNVELFITNLDSFPSNSGVYNLNTDQWVQEPANLHLKFDNDTEIDRQANDYEATINNMMKDDVSIDEFSKFKKQLQLMRINSIKQGGEFSTGNLIYKELRNRGLLDRINDYILAKFDRGLSELVQ